MVLRKCPMTSECQNHPCKCCLPPPASYLEADAHRSTFGSKRWQCCHYSSWELPAQLISPSFNISFPNTASRDTDRQPLTESRALFCAQRCERSSMANKITMPLIIHLKSRVSNSWDNKSTQLQIACRNMTFSPSLITEDWREHLIQLYVYLPNLPVKGLYISLIPAFCSGSSHIPARGKGLMSAMCEPHSLAWLSPFPAPLTALPCN